MGLVWGLVAAIVCALAYGAATVFQAIGAARTKDTGAGVDPRLLIRVLSQLPFLAGLGLDTLGLVADLIALEKLPLFAVQAIMNCSLAVTALLAVPLLKAKLSRNDWIAVATVVLGLILVGVSAGAESPVHEGRGIHWALLGAVVVLVAGSFLAIWKLGGHAVVLAAFAGSLFGAFAICVRILPDLHPTELLTDPAAYAGVIASITGFLFFTTALQRGSVTTATATLVVGETGLPALLGFTVFHDHTRHGFLPVAIIGFLCAVGGAVSLSRFGEAGPESPGSDPGSGGGSGSDGSDGSDGSSGSAGDAQGAAASAESSATS